MTTECDQDPSGLSASLPDPAGELAALRRQLGRAELARRTLRACQEAVRQARDEISLLTAVCRLAVGHGYRLAWAGLRQEDPEHRVRPVASAGFTPGYVDSLSITWDDTALGQGPTGTAIRTDRPTICRDIATDPTFAPWRQAALDHGYGSSIALPLRHQGQVLGALNVYAAVPDAFDSFEVSLLEDLADLVALGLAALRQKEVTRRAQEDWRTVFETTGHPILILDRHQRILAANRAAQETLGFAEAAMLGQRCHHLFHGSNEPPAGCPFLAMTRTDGFASAELAIETRGGFHLISCTPLFDHQGQLDRVIHISTDISERKRAEEERQRLQAQLYQSQKMESIGQLAGGVAHDFNNLLTAIIGYGELSLERLPAGDPQRADLEEILAAAGRAAQLTRSLLAFSRKQELHPQPVDLGELVRRLEKFLVRIIGEDIRLATRLTLEPLPILADPTQMDQVLLNLAANARDAMPRGGQLTITTGVVLVDPPEAARQDLPQAGPHALLSVTDNGAGMDAATRARIFEPFFTTKGKDQGTGLGLAIVYGIVRQHQGAIEVASEPGAGTSFRILLPLGQPAPAGKAIAKPAPLAAYAGGETILVVEDDAAVRKLTRRVLEEGGYRVLEAADGSAGLACFQARHQDIDLLLLDVVMPGMNGWEMLAEAKAIDPQVRFLFTSGYPADHIHDRGILGDGVSFLPKPVSPMDLLRRIRQLLDS
ncbi:MAG: ATP-binding protein [Thermodesulfobacteriota bacterium]